MKKRNFVTIVVFILLFVFISQNINTFGGVTSVDAASATKSDTRIYYNIDMSSAVLASRINQKVGGDCGVVSMATIEAYLYGAKNTSDKDKVYNALVKKNTRNNYAYWGNCGYTYYNNINWETVYDQLSKGYPVIVHRPAQSSTEGQHWAVVAGYKGSTTKLEKEKFIIVDVYLSGKHEDVVTSKAWRGSVSIDKMVTRKNGISITSLSGIRMAIDHPSVVQKKGVGHGVLGYIASNENLTSINVKVTNANTEKNLFDKTVNPNAKSYLIFNLDSEMTFAKWPAGEYFFTVIAKTATKTSYYQKYFTVDTAWPLSAPTRTYKFNFNNNGGSGDIAPQEVDYEKNLTIPTSTPKRSGYKFVGWTVLRKNDNESFYVDATWKPNSQTDISVEKKIYKPGETYNIKYAWIKECISNKEYTFYAMWEKDASVTPPSAPTAKPTEIPTAKPTETPTAKPTETPTAKPTEIPTAKPTEIPTAKPTVEVTAVTTAEPTRIPNEELVSTEIPVLEQTDAPEETFTMTPDIDSTQTPVETSDIPSADVTDEPTVIETETPTNDSNGNITEAPTDSDIIVSTENVSEQDKEEKASGLDTTIVIIIVVSIVAALICATYIISIVIKKKK